MCVYLIEQAAEVKVFEEVHLQHRCSGLRARVWWRLRTYLCNMARTRIQLTPRTSAVSILSRILPIAGHCGIYSASLASRSTRGTTWASRRCIGQCNKATRTRRWSCSNLVPIRIQWMVTDSLRCIGRLTLGIQVVSPSFSRRERTFERRIEIVIQPRKWRTGATTDGHGRG